MGASASIIVAAIVPAIAPYFVGIPMMTTLGIDLAAQPSNTGLCVVEWTGNRAVVTHLTCGVTDAVVLNWHTRSDKIGIDVPLGWPLTFVRAVEKYARGEKWLNAPSERLRYRATDRYVAKRTGWPLSVSTDRIGITAMRAASLLSRMEGSSRAGEGKIVEVYPASALRIWGFKPSGYKGKDGLENRRALLAAILRQTRGWLELPAKDRHLCTSSDNALDALAAALIARAAAIGLCEPIPKRMARLASIEGWIALPGAGSLSRLA